MFQLFFITAISYIYGIFSNQNDFLKGTLKYLFLLVNLYFLIEAVNQTKFSFIQIRDAKLYKTKIYLLKKNNRKLYNKIDEKLYKIFKRNFRESKLFYYYQKVSLHFTMFPLSILKVNFLYCYKQCLSSRSRSNIFLFKNNFLNINMVTVGIL
jgi:hypothetical protein